MRATRFNADEGPAESTRRSRMDVKLLRKLSSRVLFPNTATYQADFARTPRPATGGAHTGSHTWKRPHVRSRMARFGVTIAGGPWPVGEQAGPGGRSGPSHSRRATSPRPPGGRKNTNTARSAIPRHAPHIVVGLPVDRNRFPIERPNGNKAETVMVVPIVKQFQSGKVWLTWRSRPARGCYRPRSD